MIDCASEAARPSAETKPQPIVRAKQFDLLQQRSHERLHTQSSSPIRSNEAQSIAQSRTHSSSVVCRQRWLTINKYIVIRAFRGWPIFGCAIIDDCVWIRGLRSKIRGSEVCMYDPRIIAQSSDPRFAQQNPRTVQIRTLRLTYTDNTCSIGYCILALEIISNFPNIHTCISQWNTIRVDIVEWNYFKLL